MICIENWILPVWISIPAPIWRKWQESATIPIFTGRSFRAKPRGYWNPPPAPAHLTEICCVSLCGTLLPGAMKPSAISIGEAISAVMKRTMIPFSIIPANPEADTMNLPEVSKKQIPSLKNMICRCRKWKPLSSLTIKTIGTIVRDSGKDGKNMKQ